MFKKGDLVRIQDTEKARQRHREVPRYFPAPGTVGMVASSRPKDRDILVQWPRGSTGGNDMWFVLKELVERVESESEEDGLEDTDVDSAFCPVVMAWLLA